MNLHMLPGLVLALTGATIILWRRPINERLMRDAYNFHSSEKQKNRVLQQERLGRLFLIAAGVGFLAIGGGIMATEYG